MGAEIRHLEAHGGHRFLRYRPRSWPKGARGRRGRYYPPDETTASIMRAAVSHALTAFTGHAAAPLAFLVSLAAPNSDSEAVLGLFEVRHVQRDELRRAEGRRRSGAAGARDCGVPFKVLAWLPPWPWRSWRRWAPCAPWPRRS